MSTKKSRPSYDPKFVNSVVFFSAGSRKAVTNKAVGGLLNVHESTIRKWRSEYPDFDNAFINARYIWESRIQNTAFANLEPREKLTIIKDANGVKAIKEQVLPTHQDLIAAQKLGISKPLGGFEEQERREILAAINKRLRSGGLTYIDAVCECEMEGIDVPESWKRREYGRLVRLYDEKEINIRQLIRELRIAGLKVEPELQAEIAKELNLPPPVPDLPPMRELFDDP